MTRSSCNSTRERNNLDESEPKMEVPVVFEAYLESEPPSLVGWSIAVLLCCCLPGGIIGLIYGTKAKTEYAKGNYAEARSAYETGKRWLIGSVIASAITN